MRRFDFRLEQVLKQREAQEELAALRQAQAQAEYNSKLHHLNEARGKLDRAVQDNTLMDAMDLFNRLAYCDYMTREVKKRESDLKKSNQKLEQSRHKLVLAMQERTVLEKLKEKQYLEHRLTLSRLEQKKLDDIAARQYVRNQMQL